ncbi:MAG: ftsB [Myxococcales bacterium]|nr:ftsB [Myxococcales bacterium]
MRPLSSVWVRRLGTSALLALALGYVPYHLYGSSGLARYMRLKAERDTLHEANLKMHESNGRLRGELEALSGEDGNLSRAAVERAARDELGLVKPGEVVYKIADAPSSYGAWPRGGR